LALNAPLHLYYTLSDRENDSFGKLSSQQILAGSGVS